MTLPFSERRIQHTGNGAVKVFSYGFKLFSSADVKVIVADDDGVEFPELVLGVDYSISGIGSANGGQVTLIDASQDWVDGGGDLLTDYTITIIGEKSPVQNTSIRNQGAYYPEVIEDRFDVFMALIQELSTRLDRAIIAGDSVNINGISLGAPIADYFLAWNSTADGIVAIPGANISFASGEAPTGLINNLNTSFTIANAPISGSFRLFKNGARTTDFTLVGTTLTMNTAPNFFEELLCDYAY